ncbi:MAG: dihydrolipoamide acetyltransferase family protein [Candidatus Acidiferrales bacterium]
MAISVVMPALELTQETGKLIAWRKKEGEQVAKGEPLLEVETDKAVVEIEAPAEGILAGIRAHEGAVIPVGETIAWIVAPGERPPAEVAPVQSGSKSSNEPVRAVSSVAHTSEKPAATDLRISPKARRLAREHSIDIGRLRGSGPEGEILASDVLSIVEAKGAPAANEPEALSSVARLMAERTTQSWTSVPHFFVVREVDAGALVEQREKLGPAIEKARGVRPTHTDLLVALLGRILVQHPRLNASWAGERIRLNQEVNIAVAIAVKNGVVAPVIHNADKADLGEIAVLRRELTERARAGRLRPADIAGATFTISNLGMYGVDAFTAIISPPQAAILAVGTIADRVVPVDGRPGIRPTMTLTLSCDHRVADGARAAAFLADVAAGIREPEKWLR